MKRIATGVHKCCFQVKQINELGTKTRHNTLGANKIVITSQNRKNTRYPEKGKMNLRRRTHVLVKGNSECLNILTGDTRSIPGNSVTYLPLPHRLWGTHSKHPVYEQLSPQGLTGRLEIFNTISQKLNGHQA
jgi:hypothetical protein